MRANISLYAVCKFLCDEKYGNLKRINNKILSTSDQENFYICTQKAEKQGCNAMNKIKRYPFYVSKDFVGAFCCGLKVLVFIKIYHQKMST